MTTQVAPITDEELARVASGLIGVHPWSAVAIQAQTLEQLIARLRAAETETKELRGVLTTRTESCNILLDQRDAAKARAETAERERDAERAAGEACAHTADNIAGETERAYTRGRADEAERAEREMDAHVTGAKNEGKGG